MEEMILKEAGNLVDSLRKDVGAPTQIGEYNLLIIQWYSNIPLQLKDVHFRENFPLIFNNTNLCFFFPEQLLVLS